MTRVKRGTVVKKRHKKILKRAKGFWGSRKNLFKRAKETVLRAMAYAFTGRKRKKQEMRSLFVVRINAAAARHGLSYSKFISGLKKANINLNRKMLSQLAVYEPKAFDELVKQAQS